jgi:hypothetical protein
VEDGDPISANKNVSVRHHVYTDFMTYPVFLWGEAVEEQIFHIFIQSRGLK